MFGLLDETVFHKVLIELDAVFGDFSDHVVFGKVYRWDYGAVQLPPGAIAKNVKIRRELQTRFRKVFFAGDSLFGTSLETSFLTGSMAASQVAAHLGT
jgi:protoporphyrinogen oxidase